MSTNKLTYFNVTARAEPIRFLLHHGNIPFEDVRLSREEFVDVKSTFPFGKVPVLELDGQILHQSVVICRHLGRRLGLAGDTPEEALQCEMLGDDINDLRSLIRDYYFEANPEAKEQKKVTNLATARDFLVRLNAIAEKNGGHFVNGKLTWTDFLFSGQADNLSYLAGEELYTDFSALRQVRDNVRALPAVKKYLATCPEPLF